MKKSLRLLGILLILCITTNVSAQSDSIRLACPLDEAIVVPPPKNAIHYDPPDLCVVLMSKPDTIVKAVVTGRITNTEVDDEGKHGVVLFAKIKGKDYYFWYTGMSKAVVTRNTIVKVGQPLGYVTTGEKIEMLVYQFETPLDPSKYLDCGTVLKAF